jgi:multidrug efflux system outer membrane protein
MPPKAPAVQLSGVAPLDGIETGGGSWPAREWWKRYQDPTLDRLVELALASSPSLAEAHARYDSARQSVRIAGAASGVQVNAVADVERQRLSDNGLISPSLIGFAWYNQTDLGLQASYTFDWWGKQRATVEAAMDEAHAAQAERSAAALALASAVADAYFGWATDRNRSALAHELESTVAQEAAITAARARADLEAADSASRSALALAAVRERTAELEGSARLHEVALAALVGCSIADLPPLELRALPSLPDHLPDDVKIDLIARRADVTASRWRVQAAEQDLGSARAAFFPDVSINALAGVSSIDLGRLLEYGSRVPEVSAALHLPIFDAGRLKARYGAARAAISAAVSTYQETVVAAARDVATQAATRAQIAAERAQRSIEVDAASRLQGSAAALVRQGLTDPRPELDAAQSALEQRDVLLQLDAAALAADIALQRALGGGYESRQALAAVAARTP